MNVSDCPSIEKVRVGFRGFPDRSVRELPLLETKFPVTLKKSPAIGFADIGLTVMLAEERTVIVFRMSMVGFKSLEPLNRKVTFTRPKGWSCGIWKSNDTLPSAAVTCGDSHVSWN